VFAPKVYTKVTAPDGFSIGTFRQHCYTADAMKHYCFLCVLFAAICAVPVVAQSTQAALASPTPILHEMEMGFAYALPSDWNVIDMAPALPVIKQKSEQKAESEAEKKGVQCAQIVLTARKGQPASVVVIMALPFDCFGQKMTDNDLPAFGIGAAKGLEKAFDVTSPAYSAYSLRGHNFWIERTKGTSKQNPDAKYTIEATCTILKKGAACWLMMAPDEVALRAMESGAVTLDGDVAPELVPATAFKK
jgi:hypothetical protein